MLPAPRHSVERVTEPGFIESQGIPVPDEVQAPNVPPKLPWLRLLFFLSLSGGLGLAMWKTSQPLTFPAIVPAEKATPSPKPDAVPPVTTSNPAPPPEPAPAATPEPLSPGFMPSGGTAALTASVGSVLNALDDAATTDEKLQWIADPEKHRAGVEQFFANHTGKLFAGPLEPNPGIVIALPSGEAVKLFRVVTPECEPGAIVWMHELSGAKPALDWPLFSQTHDLAFDRFLAAQSGSQPPAPQWFTVLCARSRTSDLPDTSQDSHLALSTQGSLSGKGEPRVHVAKDSEAGRLLESKMVWGRVYLARMLIIGVKIDGKPVLMVLNCAGTATAGR